VTAPLPYGPTMTAMLTPLRKAFFVLNHWVAAPLIRAGGGPLLTTPVTGSILMLRTTGRKSGLVREAPLGYAVIDGRVVVVAGYGRSAHWFRNALANPEVEVLLPGALLAGRADEITEPDERRAVFRTLIESMGVVGRLTLGDVRGKSDAEVDMLAGLADPRHHPDRCPSRPLRPRRGWHAHQHHSVGAARGGRFRNRAVPAHSRRLLPCRANRSSLCRSQPKGAVDTSSPTGTRSSDRGHLGH
jgi:deazaflavin-dependent oxidoreductase (nitroreductase family)